MTNTELSYWLALAQMPNIGLSKFAKINEIFPNLAELFRAPAQELREFGLEALTTFDWRLVEKDLAWRDAAANRFIIALPDPLYPDSLKEISAPPAILFVEGDVSLLKASQLGIVGSRNPTAAGIRNAKEFAGSLAAAGMVITSGLALGVDAAGHEGALAVGGKTIAVLGTGLQVIYPKKHEGLAKEIIAKGGAIISEMPLTMPACPTNFPRRNRIISGLSQGILVVEATLRSGSLITARYANEQGRDVFAIPGSIHNPLARGCHALLKQGAKLVETAADILEECRQLPSQPPAKSTTVLDADHQKLLKYLTFEPTPIDSLVELSQRPISQLTPILAMLELQGYIEMTAAGYIRVAT